MKVSDADSKVVLHKTLLNCNYMQGVHRVTLNWYLPDGRASVHIVEVDINVDPFFHKIYKKGDDMDCMLDTLSFP